MTFHGTFGIHFAIHQPRWVDHSASELIGFAEFAAECGFRHIWINDNFKARHTYSLLAAIAARIESCD